MQSSRAAEENRYRGELMLFTKTNIVFFNNFFFFSHFVQLRMLVTLTCTFPLQATLTITSCCLFFRSFPRRPCCAAPRCQPPIAFSRPSWTSANRAPCCKHEGPEALRYRRGICWRPPPVVADRPTRLLITHSQSAHTRPLLAADVITVATPRR